MTHPTPLEAMQAVMDAYSPVEWLEQKEHCMPQNILDRLTAKGFTIAPIAPVTDEKLPLVRTSLTCLLGMACRDTIGGDNVVAMGHYKTIKAALTELQARRAADGGVK